MLCVRKSKFKSKIKIGTSKLEKTLDLQTLIEAIRAVKILRKALFNREQLILSKLSKSNFLDSSSEADSTDDSETKINSLLGYPVVRHVDLNLLRLIWGRRERLISEIREL
jgi:hypothetical protein